LIEVAYQLKGRLKTDIQNLLNIELSACPHDRAFELTTSYEGFIGAMSLNRKVGCFKAHDETNAALVAN
jgi:hypothetical protein